MVLFFIKASFLSAIYTMDFFFFSSESPKKVNQSAEYFLVSSLNNFKAIILFLNILQWKKTDYF